MQYRHKADWTAWCIPAGSLSGVRIGIHWTFPLLIVLETASAHARGGSEWGWCVFLSLVLLYLVIVAHEFGHVFAARRQGIGTDRVMLWPLGGIAYLAQEAQGPGEVRVALAGPAMNLTFAVLWIPVLFLMGVPIRLSLLNPFLWDPGVNFARMGFPAMVAFCLFKMNLVVLLVNLAPAFPMDGGRVLRGLLHPKHGPFRSTIIVTTVSLVLMGLLAIWAIVASEFFLFLFAAFIGISAYSTRKQVRAIQAEYELERAAFGYDLFSGGSSSPADWQATDRAAERREEKERKRREREREEARRMDREVDRLLDKISRDGITSLSRKERAFLERASRRKRELN
jgi:stage IV sporulation protein FB